jgi:hydrogenase maturation protease
LNLARVEAIADSILYEGYLLYPYRATSLKNQKRWTFGVLHPRAYSEARGGLEPCTLQSECVVTGDAASEIEMALRFLHPVSRTVERPDGRAECVVVGGRLFEPGQEAVPVRIDVGPVALGGLGGEGIRHAFVSGPRHEREAVRDQAGLVRAVVTREQERVEGTVEAEAIAVADGAWKLTIRVRNATPMPAADAAGREAAVARSLASAHVVVGVRGGAFVSLLDPPPSLRAHAEGCRNVGAWPVLAGPPGQDDLVLCSPIILEDHPAVAPESPGDLFDGTEIDEILTLRLLTLTDDERWRMAAADPRARALLDRTDALTPDQLARLHGALRRAAPPRSVVVEGTALGPGHRVRLRPAGRGDIFDLALAGRSATILSVEQDWEDRVYFTVAVDDDPGRDLGAAAPGHRFFFSPDEVVPIP